MQLLIEIRNLSNYTEFILVNNVNEATLEAVRETRAKKFARTINTDSIESLIKSCEE
jgi:hypothetical protein